LRCGWARKKKVENDNPPGGRGFIVALSEGESFRPDRPPDAGWGERYFHMRNPDGHELCFARPLLSSAQVNKMSRIQRH
jgi:hypothetical protein